MIAEQTNFVVPPSLNAAMPPEKRGIRRDHVRMLVLDQVTGEFEHSHFYRLDRFLRPGDLLVLNRSRTLPAVLFGELWRNGQRRETRTEIRLARQIGTNRWEAIVLSERVRTGDRIVVAPGLQADVIFSPVWSDSPGVTLQFNRSGSALLQEIYRHGRPIQYEYVKQPARLDDYQTVYGSVPGSVEMPSAGRAFSWELISRLQRKGIRFAFVELHTGLSYMPHVDRFPDPSKHPERFVVPPETVEMVPDVRNQGGRVIAVGTTVVRALESSLDEIGQLAPRHGWTNLHIRPGFTLKVVDGLLTGFHEPEASHLDLLTAFVDRDKLIRAYTEAIRERYLWHEFGDMNLVIQYK